MWNCTPGTEAEERVRGVGSYLDVLGRLQQELKPRNYLEIGVRHGRSLSLAHGPATGVDPAPEIQIALPNSTRIVAKTSDEFFEGDPHPVSDLAFIDGMHWFEFD